MSRAVVVYVHGLWMSGAEAGLLRRRVTAERGFAWQTFPYDSVRESETRIAAALRDTIERIDAPQVHLIGHSLGGLVIVRYLERYPMRQPGRVVFLATPANGSRAAQKLGRWPLGRRLLGLVMGEELLPDPQRRWPGGGARELGIVAGTLPIGLGHLLLKFDEANDGTVALSETQLVGAKSTCVMSVSHIGMVFSAQVARETGSFLEHGRFGL